MGVEVGERVTEPTPYEQELLRRASEDGWNLVSGYAATRKNGGSWSYDRWAELQGPGSEAEDIPLPALQSLLDKKLCSGRLSCHVNAGKTHHASYHVTLTEKGKAAVADYRGKIAKQRPKVAPAAEGGEKEG